MQSAELLELFPDMCLPEQKGLYENAMCSYSPNTGNTRDSYGSG